MVLHPEDYAAKWMDDDIKGKKKKSAKNLVQLPDVKYAISVSKHLRDTIPLDLNVSHNLDDGELEDDFVFSSGSGWVDPGVNIAWKKGLEHPLPDFLI